MKLFFGIEFTLWWMHFISYWFITSNLVLLFRIAQLIFYTFVKSQSDCLLIICYFFFKLHHWNFTYLVTRHILVVRHRNVHIFILGKFLFNYTACLQYLYHSQYYYGASLFMKKSASVMWINPGIVFTFMRQRWSRNTFQFISSLDGVKIKYSIHPIHLLLTLATTPFKS